jgi:cytochrome P450
VHPKGSDAPAGPVSGGALAHLRDFRRDRLGTPTRWARAGDAVRLRLGPYRVLLVSSPDLVREVLVAEADAFRKGPTLRAARVILGDGLLTSEGETHRRHRRVVQPTLTHGRLGGYADLMAARAGALAASWPPGACVDVHAAVQELTLGVVAETLFGADLHRDAGRLGAAVDDLLAAYDSPLLPLARVLWWLPLPSMRRVRRGRARVDEAVRRMRDARLAASRQAPGAAGDDLLGRLLAASATDARFGLRALRDEAVTLLLAGHETVASTLAWALWLLATHDEQQERAAAEAAEAGDDAGDRLPYLRAVVAEALRLYPPSWAMTRQALRDVRLDGVAVPRRTVVVASQWVVHRDARWWPQPQRFAPERWREPARRPRFAYFPFGGGPRSCVGEQFAWLEATLALRAVLQRWRMRPAAGARVTPAPLLTLRPDGAVPLIVDERVSPDRARSP